METQDWQPGLTARRLGFARALVLIALAMVVASACGGTAATRETSEPTVVAPSLPADLAAAIAFRLSFGLRADEPWVRQVALDPSARTETGVPLMPAEQVQVDRQMATASSVMSTVKSYAATQPEYAGARIDQQRGGTVVVSFSGHAAEHRAALARILPPDARLEVVEVRFTRDELLALSRQVGDGEWMRAIGAVLQSSGVDTARNMVRVQISSANPDAGKEIIEHYGGQGRMYVESDGIGVALMPTGTLVVVAVDERGRPVGSLLVNCTGDLPNTGTGDVGYGTDARGEWRADLTATGYRVDVSAAGVIVGSARAVVKAGELTTVRVTVRSR